MIVRDFMTPKPKAVKITDTLKDAAFLFYKYKVGGAPVVTSTDEVCGLITRGHIIEAAINQIPLSQPVSTVMTQSVIVVHPETTMEEAWQIPVGRLPVVDDDNKLVGMLSQKEFMEIFYSQMRRTENEVQALVCAAQNGVVVINSYGIVEVFNDAAARIIGVSVEQAAGKFIRDIIPNTGLMRILHTGKEEIGSCLEANGQKLLVNRSPICEGPKVVGALAIIQDVLETADMTKKLSTTQQKVEALECIFENLKQGIIVVDTDNIINLANHSYEDIMGIPREELLGQPAKGTIENSRMHIVLKTGIPELAELQSVKGRKVVVNRVPMFKGGNIIGAIGEAMFKDISEVSALLQRESGSQLDGKTLLGSISSPRPTFETIIGRSRGMIHVKNLAAKAAMTDTTVLILGESGTGKDLFAEAIHNASKRRHMPFVSINCAAIPNDLLEAELFGYDEGAFTGARKGGKKGRFELADQGTIFLDEIGDMPLAMQAKLLRVMQDKSFEHVGGEKMLTCDVRIIAATNKPLEEMVKQNTFREDLYYRLNVICLQLPPLRDRKEDIGELIDILIPGVCHRLEIPLKQFSPDALALLREYNWPGNVRELINLLEKIGATVNSSVITPRNLPQLGLLKSCQEDMVGGLKDNVQETRFSSERECITETLRYTKGNKALTAKILGIHRSTLYEKIKKYDLK
ncbi:MAG: sigma 54-interacting transcriptional regulator [Veillonellales bacterium]